MKHIHKALAVVSSAVLAFAMGCSHPRILESIEIQPSSATVSGPGASFTQNSRQFTAIGHFINPGETENITDKVTWASDTPDIAFVSNTPPTNGLVTSAGLGVCGTSLITATANRSLVGTGTSNAVVIGTATFTVNDSSNPACGGTAQPVLTVAVSGAGLVTGTTSTNASTTIVGCTQSGGANCVATLPLGTTINLTTSAPATFSSNCATTSATSCQIVTNGNENVTVTF